jgi:ATP-dependent helicase/nuclease subunit B
MANLLRGRTIGLVSLEVKWEANGRPATEALNRAIGLAKGDEPLAPVTVVVPSNYVGVSARRLLGSGSFGSLCNRGIGLAAVSFLTVYRMAELLGSSSLAGAGRRPVSNPVIAAAFRGALAEEPGIFAPVADHAATEAALVAAYRELRDLSPASLDSLAGRSARAADVVRLHRMARSRLEPEWYDEEDLIDAAIQVLSTDESAIGGLGKVIVYLPERLSLHGARLLRTVAERTDVMVLAGTTGDPNADAEVAMSLRRLNGTEKGAGPDHSDPWSMVDADRTRIVTASDCDEEVREAVRAIVDATRAGTPLDRIAILHASLEPYGRLTHEQLSAAGIPFNGAAVMPLTARVAGRTLLQMLALLEGDFRREDLFAWMAGAPLRTQGHDIPVTAWERLSREAGVVSGRAHWDKFLETLAVDLDGEATREEEDPDTPSWRAEKYRRDAERARGLREFVLAVIDDLTAAKDRHLTWGETAAWAHHHLDELLGGERRRTRWPTAEQKAAERVERALDRLASLDSVEKSVSLDVFTRTLELELESDLGRVGRMGDGVLVGSIDMGVGLDLDLLVVLGLAEGLCPSPTHDDSLLPDHEREAAGGELPLRSGRVERQHRQLLAALAGVSHQVLCVPRGDLRRNVKRVPSRWLLQIASAIDGEEWSSEKLLGAERPWLKHVASFDAGLRRMDFPASAQEHRLRSLMAQGTARLDSSSVDAIGDATLRAGSEVVRARHSDRFTRFDGNLAGLDVPSPAETTTSATRLEGWAACPYAYLLHSVLRIDEVESPEEQLQISPRDWGSLIHQALEDFITEVLARDPVDGLRPPRPWSESDRALMAEIGERVCNHYESHGLTGRPVFWQRDRKRIIADLERFLKLDSAHRIEFGTWPVAAELSFGFSDSEVGPVSLQILGGRSVDFRGFADRVDAGADGTIHVVDYKTGRPDDYLKLSEVNPDDLGRRLQLAVYGQAARMLMGTPEADVRAEYWFVSAKGKFRRVGYSVTPDVLARVGKTVGMIVAGIEAGVFPNNPTASSTSTRVECAFCDPDALGVADLRRQLDRKQSDLGLALFRNLVDPPALIDLDPQTEELPDA